MHDFAHLLSLRINKAIRKPEYYANIDLQLETDIEMYNLKKYRNALRYIFETSVKSQHHITPAQTLHDIQKHITQVSSFI